MDSNEIEIKDRVTNLSDRYGTFQMLYHNNFGSPVSGCRITTACPGPKSRHLSNRHAAQGIAHWNEYWAPDSKYVEQVYFLDLVSDDRNRSLVLLTNDDESLGASIRYRTDNLPCFTLWKNTVGAADGYVTGLEPGTNFPNPRSFEEQQGRVVGLDAGESLEFEFSIGILVGRDQVSTALTEIRSLSPSKPELIGEPLPNWSVPE